MELMQTKAHRRAQAGITLIELMVVMVIVGVLAAIAYPSYRNQVMRSTRTEARVALEQRALQLEKCFTRYMAYNAPLCTAGAVAGDSNTASYAITISPPAGNVNGFTLTATAQGPQANDAACRIMTLDDRGQRTPAACW